LQVLDFVKTTSEGKRLIAQGGVKIDEAVVTEEKLAAPPESFVLRCGKRKFARVTLRRG
jgi:tyrosyl-tRNA synthetase